MSDRWFASAPCQTWPNRFFAHCGTAGGWVNNSLTHFPYMMRTVFDLLDEVGKDWRIDCHDIPQAATLARLWPHAGGFRHFDAFLDDAAKGVLPAYGFIEPRYFTDTALGEMPNDDHPPHDVRLGEALIAAVYNALRASPLWTSTLLLIVYDEHGGCYDHAPPPRAVPPGSPYPDGFSFDRFGPRVPAVLVSPYVAPGSAIRPRGRAPFHHTSIIATLRRLFWSGSADRARCGGARSARWADSGAHNPGPERIDAPSVQPSALAFAVTKARLPNDMQRALGAAAAQLPTAGADHDLHIRRIGAAPMPVSAQAAGAAEFVAAHGAAFLGET